MSNLKGFGNRLKTAIKKSNYTQKQVSEIMGINQDTLTNYIKEKTYPKIDFLISLCQLTCIQLNWLLTGTEPKNNASRETNDSSTEEEISKDELRIIKLLRKLDTIERAKIEGMIEIKLYETESKKTKKSSTYQSGEEAATRELA